MDEELNIDNKVKVVKISDHRMLTAKLNVYDWMSDIDTPKDISEVVEIRFKNTRKGFYHNHAMLPLKAGEIVAVEASPGHDIGIVSLTGELVREQMKKYSLRKDVELKKVYRKAKPHDIEKWQAAISLEHETMIKSRKLTEDLGLNMKIGDVEYQGDKTKAIFYYIADERVDFRQLIRVLAETFRIRIEMKQIGARQEAGRIGGIGPCGRPLCCSSFITNFVSVTTAAARYQDISLNPQKLAGQCSKLKCCLNYEVDAYVDAQKDIPSTQVHLKTRAGDLRHIKTDIFGRKMTYIYNKDGVDTFVTLPVERVKYIMAQNKLGKVVETILREEVIVQKKVDYENVVGQDSLHRFDNEEKSPRKKNNKRNVRNKRRFNKKGKEDSVSTNGEAKGRVSVKAKTQSNSKQTPKQQSKQQSKQTPKQGKQTSKDGGKPNNKLNKQPNNKPRPNNKPKVNKPNKPKE